MNTEILIELLQKEGFDLFLIIWSSALTFIDLNTGEQMPI